MNRKKYLSILKISIKIILLTAFFSMVFVFSVIIIEHKITNNTTTRPVFHNVAHTEYVKTTAAMNAAYTPNKKDKS